MKWWDAKATTIFLSFLEEFLWRFEVRKAERAPCVCQSRISKCAQRKWRFLCMEEKSSIWKSWGIGTCGPVPLWAPFLEAFLTFPGDKQKKPGLLQEIHPGPHTLGEWSWCGGGGALRSTRCLCAGPLAGLGWLRGSLAALSSVGAGNYRRLSIELPPAFVPGDLANVNSEFLFSGCLGNCRTADARSGAGWFLFVIFFVQHTWLDRKVSPCIGAPAMPRDKGGNSCCIHSLHLTQTFSGFSPNPESFVDSRKSHQLDQKLVSEPQ